MTYYSKDIALGMRARLVFLLAFLGIVVSLGGCSDSSFESASLVRDDPYIGNDGDFDAVEFSADISGFIVETKEALLSKARIQGRTGIRKSKSEALAEIAEFRRRADALIDPASYKGLEGDDLRQWIEGNLNSSGASIEQDLTSAEQAHILSLALKLLEKHPDIAGFDPSTLKGHVAAEISAGAMELPEGSCEGLCWEAYDFMMFEAVSVFFGMLAGCEIISDIFSDDPEDYVDLIYDICVQAALSLYWNMALSAFEFLTDCLLECTFPEDPGAVRDRVDGLQF